MAPEIAQARMAQQQQAPQSQIVQTQMEQPQMMQRPMPQQEMMQPQMAPQRMAQPRMQQRPAPIEYGGYPQRQVVQRPPVNRYGPGTQQFVQRSRPNAYGAGQMVRRPTSQMNQQMGSQMSPQMAPPRGQVARGGGNQREYEGAIEYLGTTDRVVTPAEAPQMARGGQPTLAEPIVAEPEQTEVPVRQAQGRRPVQR
jgi:hypothetical protein